MRAIERQLQHEKNDTIAAKNEVLKKSNQSAVQKSHNFERQFTQKFSVGNESSAQLRLARKAFSRIELNANLIHSLFEEPNR